MNAKKKASALGIFSFLSPAFPLGLSIAFFIFALLAAAVDEGWMVFFGAIFFYVAMTFVLPICSTVGLICSVLSLRKYSRKTRYIVAAVCNSILLIASIPLIASFFSNI